MNDNYFLSVLDLHIIVKLCKIAIKRLYKYI